MSKILSLSLLFLCTWCCTSAQLPYSWAKNTNKLSVQSLTVDKYGYVYHCGSFTLSIDADPGPGFSNLYSNGSDDVYFVKYDNAGNYVWAQSIGGGLSDRSYKIITDDTANIYIVGYVTGDVDLDPGPGIDIHSCTGSVIFFAKFDSAGNYQWGKHLEGSYNETCNEIAVDKYGFIYIAGTLYENADFDPGPGVAMLSFPLPGNHGYMAKYDNNGNYLHAVGISDAANHGVFISGMGIDSLSNVYIGGSFADTMDFDPGPATAILYTINSNDIYFAKYDSALNYIWAKSAYGGATSGDNVSDLVVNNTGLYICGEFDGNPSDFDPGPGVAIPQVGKNAYFARYDLDGNFIYVRTLNSTGNPAYLPGMAVDGDANVYLAGEFIATIDFNTGTGVNNITWLGGTFDMFIASYNDSGYLNYVQHTATDKTEGCRAIALDAANNIFVCGIFNDTTDFDPGPGIAELYPELAPNTFVAKYGDSVLPIKVQHISATQNVIAHPNPFNGRLTIESGTDIDYITITDITGKLVHTQHVGDKRFTWNANAVLSTGIYIVRMVSGNEVSMMKVEKR
jgi:hypothetical protein